MRESIELIVKEINRFIQKMSQHRNLKTALLRFCLLIFNGKLSVQLLGIF